MRLKLAAEVSWLVVTHLCTFLLESTDLTNSPALGGLFHVSLIDALP